MATLTKYTSFEELKQAENAATVAAATKQKLNLDAKQAASILSILRLQQQQKNARKQ